MGSSTATSVRKAVAFSFLFGVLAIACALRSAHLADFHLIDHDEISWLLSGKALLDTGTPSGWTIYHAAYAAHGATDSSNVTPYLDHPPLFALGIGLWAKFVGQSEPWQPDWRLVRLPMIAISLLSILAAWAFVKRAFGTLQANFTLLAFAFLPSHVVTSRLIAPEHLIGLFLTLGMYAFVAHGEAETPRLRRRWLLAMASLSIAAPLLKLSGIVVPATLVFAALTLRRIRLAATLMACAVASLGLFAAYGATYDWDLFVALLEAHAERAQTFAYFWSIFTHLDIGHYPFFDVSLIVGVFGALSLALRSESRPVGHLLVAALVVFSFLFLYVAPVELYGWYKYALYPLIAIGLGHVFNELYQGRVVFLVLFLPLLAMMLQQSEILYEQDARRNALIVLYGIVMAAVLIRRGPFQLRYALLSLLALLFAIEAVWVSKVLGVLPP